MYFISRLLSPFVLRVYYAVHVRVMCRCGCVVRWRGGEICVSVVSSGSSSSSSSRV